MSDDILGAQPTDAEDVGEIDDSLDDQSAEDELGTPAHVVTDNLAKIRSEVLGPRKKPYSFAVIAKHIADQLGKPVSRQAVSLWFSQKHPARIPRMKHLQTIADFYNVTVHYFLDEEVAAKWNEQMAAVQKLAHLKEAVPEAADQLQRAIVDMEPEDVERFLKAYAATKSSETEDPPGRPTPQVEFRPPM